MPAPDTPAYYVVMFGTAVLIPILLAALGYLTYRAIRSRSWASIAFASVSALALFATIIVNPLSNCILFVPGSNARVEAMHETANSEGFVGKTLTEFAKRFGQPDYERAVKNSDYDLFVYTGRPWYQYGWDELVVFTRDDVILEIYIDD